MAKHILGPLHYERLGPTGRPIVFIHSNPMDQSSWLYQMAHFSTWHRCLGIDIPGYGRSPRATAGVTQQDVAEACWEAIDAAFPGGEPAILVGCSIGAFLVQRMCAMRPADTAAIVMCGIGYYPKGSFDIGVNRANDYRKRGIDLRYEHAFNLFSPVFRATPLAQYFAELFAERNGMADADSIIHQFLGSVPPDDEELRAIRRPSLLLIGSEDALLSQAFVLQEKITGCELRVIQGAGHTCHMEQPWQFDRHMVEFLRRHRVQESSA